MSESQKASFGKKLASGGMIKLAPFAAVLAVIYCIAVTVFASYYSNQREEALRPHSILSQLKQGASLYAKKNGRFPTNLVELETIWHKPESRDSSPRTFAPDTRHAFFYGNCSYRYYSDSTGQVAGFWIVPKGTYRNDYNTLFVLLVNERSGISEQVWKGAALTDENETLIPERAVPGAKELSLLGMTKQRDTAPMDAAAGQKKNSFPFSLFK